MSLHIASPAGGGGGGGGSKKPEDIAVKYANALMKGDAEAILKLFPKNEQKYYENETFIRLLEPDVYPETKWVEGSNFVDINFKIDQRTGRIIMMGALDNLVKGAAGQAVQNMNLMFGEQESEGLLLVPMFP